MAQELRKVGVTILWCDLRVAAILEEGGCSILVSVGTDCAKGGM